MRAASEAAVEEEQGGLPSTSTLKLRTSTVVIELTLLSRRHPVPAAAAEVVSSSRETRAPPAAAPDAAQPGSSGQCGPSSSHHRGRGISKNVSSFCLALQVVVILMYGVLLPRCAMADLNCDPVPGFNVVSGAYSISGSMIQSFPGGSSLATAVKYCAVTSTCAGLTWLPSSPNTVGSGWAVTNSTVSYCKSNSLNE